MRRKLPRLASKRIHSMSYTLNIEPSIVKEAETCALRNGTTIDAMIRACLLVLASHGAAESGGSSSTWWTTRPKAQSLKIGSMRNEINLPENFDEVFDSLDQDVASMFNGADA